MCSSVSDFNSKSFLSLFQYNIYRFVYKYILGFLVKLYIDEVILNIHFIHHFQFSDTLERRGILLYIKYTAVYKDI